MTESSSRVVFRDPQRKLPTRVSDLLARLSPAQKIALLHQHQAPIPELGVAGFRTGTEALHGVAWLGTATVFPQAIGLASSWDPDLLRRVGEAVGAEVRAMHHADPAKVGLNVWAPVVNPLRDPRWGRNEEGYSEDPWLTGVLSTAYAGGLRGDHPQWLRTAPTLKHFLAYNNETDRCLTSSNLPPRVLHEYELPAFRPAIAAGAAVAVMASYNLVNGRPTHVSPLINEVLRGWPDDDVMVVGDAMAVHNLAGDQRWEPDQVAGFAAALRSGIDCVTEDGDDPGPTIARFTSALERGLITESDVDAAVRRILSVRIRLGEFNPADDPYRAPDPSVIDSPAHRSLAREAARASVVLLTNDGILPLDRASGGRIAVIGPLADAVFDDWYSGTPPYRTTLRDALIAATSPTAAPAATSPAAGASAASSSAAAAPGAFSGGSAAAGSSAAAPAHEPVLFHEGVDRVLLRCSDGTLVTSDDGLRVRDLDGAPDESLFDVLDWGQETISLRAVANGLFVGFDGELFRDDQPGPNGWEVKETFEVVPAAGGVALRHLQTGAFVRSTADGSVRPTATHVADATVFTVDVLVDGVAQAARVAASADVVVLALGNHPMVCGRETIDRRDLDLPGTQAELLRAVHAANPRTVLALTSSYPYAIGWAKEHLPAVLWSAHGGQEHGAALADVLFGTEPAGRLTQTWYADDSELPDLLDYDIVATDATYLYYRGTPLFPFGHGLSYSRFEYAGLRLSSDTVDADGTVTVTAEVTNVGPVPGDEVVQLYTRQRHSRVKQPLRRLRGYQRVRLAPGERIRVEFTLNAADLAFWDVTRSRWVAEDAAHTIALGSSSRDWALTTTLRVRGEVIPPRTARSGLRLIDNDGYAGTTPVAITPAPGEALRSRIPDAWALFAGVDLDGGLHQVSIVASGSAPTSGDGGTITLRLDDPLTGPVLATLPVPVASAHDTVAGLQSPPSRPGPVQVPPGEPDPTQTLSSPAQASPGPPNPAQTPPGPAQTPPGPAQASPGAPNPAQAAPSSPAQTPVRPTRGPLSSVQAPLGPVSGIHDVFVLFDRPGLTLATVAFS
ncbi:glycoside hydrolase family 3 protein [Actinoplanes siamensis]|uniref:Exo-alpha-(1->6)-L-arabinopyranosidase n=1 Tax=Actinoplanes siamensis TaxID=1223317 RepID=A0A919N8Y5_9ACTN|nr:glycoside hydrolase family 3 protein [Actinoplanes siamensis]GIF06694.1 sugar hydrolase [Actinoplanes siamensis]